MHRLANKGYVFALGGVNEIGKNMYVIEYGEDIFIIDCGSKFPDESLLGIDLIIPDISYLLSKRENVRAMIVTHGHEDHIGGIPYILKQLNVPIYATRLTLGLIESKLKEHGLLADSSLNAIDADSVLEIGQLQVSFFRTNHSIPDCVGVVFDTPQGAIVHTGDFKFDLTPENKQYPDLHRMASIGSNGVLLLLSESTNAERPGFTPSERLVGEQIEKAFKHADQRIFLSTFASNVNRLQQVVNAAAKVSRKIVLLGRSMVNVVEVAQALGYLDIPDGMLIEPEEASGLPLNQVAVLCTGSQGEPMAALSRLANGSYRQMEVLAGDTVIVAASPIPGNEKSVARIIDNLYQLGAKVIYGSGASTGMHVSGHGSQEELKLMLSLMKPNYFVPIHGEYRMLHQHRLLAEAVGVDPKHILIVGNGDLVELEDGDASLGGKVPSGDVFVDGLGIGDIGNVVLRDRKQLSGDGILIVVVSLSKKDGSILSGPDIISRGFVYVRDNELLIEQINAKVLATLQELKSAEIKQWNVMKRTLKDEIGSFLFAQLKRRPMIMPILIEI
ncbi:ribonuclease J [Cohnella lubricantis]|uniref:Ribonuclease J n=1 Tax=Cohnella lubricantis TaxID=2163172 RepID=A0A841TFW6_9BACL|nr:ribonuclease J [Cohnella lubricantis]MBB6677837.1 ribonuclease J [Cohnella lubricantis]MBP2119016.1 ribonuclease J [Cohnella lubricantis]